MPRGKSCAWLTCTLAFGGAILLIMAGDGCSSSPRSSTGHWASDSVRKIYAGRTALEGRARLLANVLYLPYGTTRARSEILARLFHGSTLVDTAYVLSGTTVGVRWKGSPWIVEVMFPAPGSK